ncbi:hypothetical protein QVD17_03195 [Tagetes erecta]|uniref:Uncharacterized protein n=1 Tax=Tagetes erecta TaxID=13708 RepID=A0AAD8P9J7_TARER|nr:hypothetical protein QVD17_03195 [Tagetes erecta]
MLRICDARCNMQLLTDVVKLVTKASVLFCLQMWSYAFAEEEALGIDQIQSKNEGERCNEDKDCEDYCEIGVCFNHVCWCMR